MNRKTNVLIGIVIVLIVLGAAIVYWRGTGTPAGPSPNGGGTPDVEAFSVFVPDDPALIARDNEGVGLMGQYQYEQAHDIFAELSEAHPNWLDVKVNLAFATLNRQAEGDEQLALDYFSEVLERDPTHLRAHYGSGLLKLYLQSPEEAIEHFKFVAKADAQDAYAAYYVGQCLFQDRQYEEALPWYEKSLELDNFLRSAYYGLAQTCQRIGQAERAIELLDQFNTLKNNPRSKLIEFVYTRMGPKGEAIAIDLPKPRPLSYPEGDIFKAAAPLSAGLEGVHWNDETRRGPSSITACDLNGDGNVDLFLADALREGDDVNNALFMNNGDGTFALELDHILATVSAVNAPLWGDYDNDGLTDVYFCRRGANQLWRQTAPNEWRDVTAESGADNAGYDTVDGAMFDADHDGDLDLFCVNDDGPNELFNNNLDGTFRPIAQDQGIAGDGGSSRQVLVTDLDRDRDADIVVINADGPHEVYINDRGWAYRPAEGYDAFRGADIRAALAADINADGLGELYTLDAQGTVTRWKGDLNRDWTGMSIHPADQVTTPTTFQLAVADVTGDGSLNVLSSTGSTWHVVNHQVQPGFRRPFVPADKIGLAGWAAVNVGCGQGPSIVGLPAGGPPVIWSPGTGRFGYVTLTFSGLEDKGKSMRSNASGIGTYAQARMDSRWTARDTYRGASGPGQSLQPLAFGTAGFEALDFVKIDWSDGVMQTEMHDVQYINKDQVDRTRDLSSGSCERIEQIQRLTSSCPVLFAFNGESFEFVSDVLGVGGMGYMVAPGVYAPPRPWENLLLPDGALKPRDGQYLLKLGEPMQEACYIDAVRLVSYDLPPGWHMTLDERMSILGPEPTGRPLFYRRSIRPILAVNDRAEDVTERVAQADLVAAPVGDLDHRFIGRLADDNVVTITFDRPIDASMTDGMQAVLVADGWIEYPYSQTMFAAWQAGADYRAPTIEARGADGTWTVVLEQFGYPAGMPRQMAVPLPTLPEGTRELRISTNQEIYWDRFMIAFAETCPEVRKTELQLQRSNLRRSGFARHTTSGQAVPHYAYDDRSPFWDTRAPTGMYTRFGPVDELVREGDDALAIIGPGEEVHLEFGAPTTDVQPGWSRHLVVETEGWCKDMDLYTKDGLTVGPLPSVRSDTTGRDALHERYNTRPIAGE